MPPRLGVGDEFFLEVNRTRPGDLDRRRELMEQIFASVGEGVVLNSPLSAAFGSNTSIGDGFYGNSNLMLVDDVAITIGDGVLIGPNLGVSSVSAGGVVAG